jgi:hypothetical protein
VRFHDVESNPVGVHLQMPPWPFDPHDRRVGRLPGVTA